MLSLPRRGSEPGTRLRVAREGEAPRGFATGGGDVSPID